MNLGGAEAVNIDLREMRLDVAEQVLVPFERNLGVKPPLHQDLIAADLDGFLDLLEQHVSIQHIRLGVTDLAVERAKVADGGANVGVIDVSIDVEGAVRLGMEPFADEVGGAAERQEIGGAEEFDAVLEA